MSMLLLTMGPNLSIMADIPAVGVGNPGVIRFRPIGAIGPVKWTLVDSTLPAEWDSALNPDGNAVTLTTADAETAGTFSVTVRAVDNARIPVVRSFDVRVVALPLTISGAFPAWSTGVPATGALTIIGGQPPYSGLAVTSGALPSGVSLSIIWNQIVASGAPDSTGAWEAGLLIYDSVASVATAHVSGTVMPPPRLLDMPLRANMLDLSGHVVTNVGGCYINPTGGPDGNGCVVCPSGAYLSVALDAKYADKDFIFSARVRGVDITSSFQGLLSLESSVPLDFALMTITMSQSTIWLSVTGTGWQASIPAGFSVGSWNTFTLRRESGILSASLNGVPLGTVSVGTSSLIQKGPTLILGKKSNALGDLNTVELCDVFSEFL